MFLIPTFDDGPHPRLTPMVLDHMAALGAKGVFFVLTSRPLATLRSLNEIHRRGHLLALHGVSHIPHTDLAESGQLFESLKEGKKAIEDLTGQQVKYVRPPYWFGFGRQEVRQTWAEAGLTPVYRNVHSGDTGFYFKDFWGWFWDLVTLRQATPLHVLRNISRNTKKAIKDGAADLILSLHDSNARTVENLPRYLSLLSMASNQHRQGLEIAKWASSAEEVDEALQRFTSGGFTPREGEYQTERWCK
jgi:peptidoglycan/xylan/chitin deacetylase (PgdA/CDA1 family)